MDINRLHEFTVLADCLNYSKAANLLYMTQPVLSRHIHDLEDTIGAPLFVRDTHKVSLTKVGELAAQELAAVVACYDRAFHTIRQATDTENSRISVGFLGYAVKPFIKKFSTSFQEQHPRITVSYQSADLDHLIDSISKDEMDLAFVSHVYSDLLKSTECCHLTDDRLCLAVPAEHPVSKKDSISFSEISELPLIGFHKDTNHHTAEFHEKLFQKLNAKMNVVRTVHNVESGIFYVGMDAGVFIIPQHLSFMAADLPVIPIRDEEAVLSLHLIWKKANTKSAVRTFAHDIAEMFQEQD